MFFFIEIVIFPAMCGLLLNLSTLPLIPEATFFTRISYYYNSPVSAIFLTWLAGTNFMFSFAQVISIVRKCIRKGVLYFIRDPSDPEVCPFDFSFDASTSFRHVEALRVYLINISPALLLSFL